MLASNIKSAKLSEKLKRPYIYLQLHNPGLNNLSNSDIEIEYIKVMVTDIKDLISC